MTPPVHHGAPEPRVDQDGRGSAEVQTPGPGPQALEDPAIPAHHLREAMLLVHVTPVVARIANTRSAAEHLHRHDRVRLVRVRPVPILQEAMRHRAVAPRGPHVMIDRVVPVVVMIDRVVPVVVMIDPVTLAVEAMHLAVVTPVVTPVVNTRNVGPLLVRLVLVRPGQALREGMGRHVVARRGLLAKSDPETLAVEAMHLAVVTPVVNTRNVGPLLVRLVLVRLAAMRRHVVVLRGPRVRIDRVIVVAGAMHRVVEIRVASTRSVVELLHHHDLVHRVLALREEMRRHAAARRGALVRIDHEVAVLETMRLQGAQARVMQVFDLTGHLALDKLLVIDLCVWQQDRRFLLKSPAKSWIASCARNLNP